MTSAGVQATATDRKHILIVIHWILMVLMCLSAMAKLGTKWELIRNLQYDDAHTVVAMLFSIGYGVAATYQIRAGAGSLLEEGPSSDFLKATYISEIFYVFSLCFAKMIVLQMLSLLSRNTARRVPVYTAMVFTAVWTITMVLAISFQCALPHPWRLTSADCLDQNSFWAAFAAFDALIDTATGALSVFLFYDINMPWKVKAPVVLAFASRIFLVPITVYRLVYQRMALASANRPFDDFAVVLLTSIHVNFGIVLTCVTFLKPVISGIQSGILSGDIRSLATLDTNYLFTSSRRHKTGWASHELSAVRRPKFPKREAHPRGESEEDMVIRETREVDVSSTVIDTMESVRAVPHLG